MVNDEAVAEVSPMVELKELPVVAWDHCDEAEEGSDVKSLAEAGAENNPLVVDDVGAVEGAAEGIPVK